MAIRSEVVEEILPDDDKLTEAGVHSSRQGTGFFDSGLEYASSPFHKPPVPQKEMTTRRQYFLTTADWLTMSQSFEIVVDHRRIKARLDYRNDAENVALLSIERQKGIISVDVYPEADRIPGVVYVVLNPDSIYERMTQHVLNITENNRYGTANMQARNGYPLFDEMGRLVGLSVGPEPAHRFTRVVHPRLLDIALHPSKYSMERIVNIDAVSYTH